MMNREELLRRGEMHSMGIAAERIVHVLHMLDSYYKVRQLGPILRDDEEISRSDLRRALDYLAESGYITVRTIKEKTSVDVMDAALDDLECKLTPKGTRLAGGYETDALVKP